MYRQKVDLFLFSSSKFYNTVFTVMTNPSTSLNVVDLDNSLPSIMANLLKERNDY